MIPSPRGVQEASAAFLRLHHLWLRIGAVFSIWYISQESIVLIIWEKSEYSTTYLVLTKDQNV